MSTPFERRFEDDGIVKSVIDVVALRVAVLTGKVEVAMGDAGTPGFTRFRCDAETALGIADDIRHAAGQVMANEAANQAMAAEAADEAPAAEPTEQPAES